MIWSFLAGVASMFALMCVCSMWAGLQLAKHADQDEQRMARLERARQSVASRKGASAENTRAGAQPAAMTAFAKPLGASAWQRVESRSWIVLTLTEVLGVVVATTSGEARSIAWAAYGDHVAVIEYCAAPVWMMCAADEMDDKADRASKEQHA